MMYLAHICLALVLLAGPIRAQVPKVVSDIAPVQSLVAMVMQGLGTPDLLVTAGASPHGSALRPSQARALQAADLVVWVGPELTPWLDDSIGTLAGGAAHLELLRVPGTHLLAFRDESGEADNRQGQPQSGIDPHAWLDPYNGRVWLARIAEELARIDPDNAARYRANALSGQAEIDDLRSALEATLASMQGHPYVTFHDAYQYFEARFGLTPTGAVTASDATHPSPTGLARLRRKLEAGGVTCAFSESQYDPGLLYAAMGRDDLKVIPLDPMGSRLERGPGLYLGVLRDAGAAFAKCRNPG